MNHQFSARLKELRAHFHLSQQEFGDMCGLSQKTVSNLEQGRDAKALYLELMERAFPQVRPSWLRSGVGAMLTPAPTAAPVADAFAGLTSGAATVEYATRLVAMDAMRETIALQNERIADLRSTVEFLKVELGKSSGSADATGRFAPTAPRPVIDGFQTSQQQAAAKATASAMLTASFRARHNKRSGGVSK